MIVCVTETNRSMFEVERICLNVLSDMAEAVGLISVRYFKDFWRISIDNVDSLH